jgi:hypothetical protein
MLLISKHRIRVITHIKRQAYTTVIGYEMPALVYEPLECSMYKFSGKENNKNKVKTSGKRARIKRLHFL